MLTKQFTDLSNPELWKLSEKDDVIINKEGSNEQRVLINYETYKSIKEAVAVSKHHAHSADSFDLNPYLQDFIDILQNDQFEDITNNDHYFENFVRKVKSGE